MGTLGRQSQCLICHHVKVKKLRFHRLSGDRPFLPMIITIEVNQPSDCYIPNGVYLVHVQTKIVMKVLLGLL